jgi:fructokinase
MRIGIDLGGTKVEGMALADDGRELARRRVATPRHDYDATLAALVGAIEDETGERGSVGVGMPGAISPASGLVKNANSTWLIGRAIDRDLERALGRPVRCANDADCFALSEATDGAGEGARVVFGVIVGTGTGGGIVVDGSVLTGPNAIAGEWGHMPLPWPLDDERPGPPCYCGKAGCVETFLSGPGLARDYRGPKDAAVDAAEVARRAERGDEEALAALGRYEDRMARALAVVLNLLDPDVVVLGGGMSHLSRLYESVPRLWQAWAFSDRVTTPLRPPRHGDSSGVRGAAWLWGR